MSMASNKGLIYTNDNCIGCNKCISACNIINANKVNLTENGYRVDVNGLNCINCGACFDVCEHNARSFYDDTEAFFDDLKKGENITLLLAPSFLANYPEEYGSILGGLKSLGVNRIISVSFGADITTWGYLNYLSTHDLDGGISQPCPAVVNYIEHYIPELIPKLVPVHSPMMCAAIYAKKYMNITDKLAFIGPCIAKKSEMGDPNTGGYISYNVTFKHLLEYVRKNNISGPEVQDEIEYGGGAIYPIPGGLKENVRWFCGESAFVRQVEGEKWSYDFLEDYKNSVLEEKRLPFMVDVLNCSKGCIYGTGVEESKLTSEDNFYEIQDIKVKLNQNSSDNPWNKDLDEKERLDNLNQKFAHLDVNDFIRCYSDKSKISEILIPTQEEQEEIYQKLKKYTEEDRVINCSSCGFDTCNEMTIAIHNDCSHVENCIYYIKSVIQEEKEEIQRLSEDLEDKNATIVSSINYASKIQKNLLPRVHRFEESFSDYSLIWNPRDVVGGDVFWLKSFSEGSVLCVCDCTGHGVPGALITMLVVSIFESNITEDNYKDTAEIMWILEEALVNVLHAHSNKYIKDGCDLAILYIAKDGTITISSGNTNVFVCDGKEAKRIKGQRIYIGEGKLKSKDQIEMITIPANPDNKFYIATDGLFDQCGEHNAYPIPFGYKRFSQIILEHHQERQSVISKKVWDAFEEYRGEEKRIDDLQLITFKPRSFS